MSVALLPAPATPSYLITRSLVGPTRSRSCSGKLHCRRRLVLVLCHAKAIDRAPPIPTTNTDPPRLAVTSSVRHYTRSRSHGPVRGVHLVVPGPLAIAVGQLDAARCAALRCAAAIDACKWSVPPHIRRPA